MSPSPFSPLLSFLHQVRVLLWKNHLLILRGGCRLIVFDFLLPLFLVFFVVKLREDTRNLTVRSHGATSHHKHALPLNPLVFSSLYSELSQCFDWKEAQMEDVESVQFEEKVKNLTRICARSRKQLKDFARFEKDSAHFGEEIDDNLDNCCLSDCAVDHVFRKCGPPPDENHYFLKVRKGVSDEQCDSKYRSNKRDLCCFLPKKKGKRRNNTEKGKNNTGKRFSPLLVVKSLAFVSENEEEKNKIIKFLEKSLWDLSEKVSGKKYELIQGNSTFPSFLVPQEEGEIVYFPIFKTFFEEKELENLISSALYPQEMKVNKTSINIENDFVISEQICGAVVFKNPKNAEKNMFRGVPHFAANDISYSLRFNFSIPVPEVLRAPLPHLLLDTAQVSAPRFSGRGFHPLPYLWYQASGFAAMQALVEAFLLKEQLERVEGKGRLTEEYKAKMQYRRLEDAPSDWPPLPFSLPSLPSVWTVPFPTLAHTEDILFELAGPYLSLIFVLGLSLPTSKLISLLSFEQEKGMRDLHVAAGFSPAAVDLAWVIFGFLYFLGNAALLTFACFFGRLFPQTSFISLFLVFSGPCLSASSFGFCLSLPFKDSKTASIFGAILFVLCAIPALASGSCSPFLLDCLCLLPPSALLLALTRVMYAEAGGGGVQGGGGFFLEDDRTSVGRCVLISLYSAVFWICVFFLHRWVVMKREREAAAALQLVAEAKSLLSSPLTGRTHLKLSQVEGGSPSPSSRAPSPPSNEVYLSPLPPSPPLSDLGGGELVVLDRIVKRYGRSDNSLTRALDGASLSIHRGECIVLLGRNGAGKSTLMKVLTGELPPDPDGGEVRRSPSCKVAFCPQDDRLWPELTVKDHLLFFGMARGCSWGEAEALGVKMAEDAGLAGHLDRASVQLSGGMQRKLMVLCALVHKEVLVDSSSQLLVVLDEPTAGLDIDSRKDLWSLIRDFREASGLKARLSFLISTHMMDEAEELADKVAIMSRGKLVCVDSPVALKSSYCTGYKLSVLTPSPLIRDRVGSFFEDVPSAELVSSNGSSETVVYLHASAQREVPQILRGFESALPGVGFGVQTTSLEDVFFVVVDKQQELEEEGRERGGGGGGGRRNSQDEPIVIPDYLFRGPTKLPPHNCREKLLWKIGSYFRSFWIFVRYRKFPALLRDRRLLTCQMFFPLLFVLAALNILLLSQFLELPPLLVSRAFVSPTLPFHCDSDAVLCDRLFAEGASSRLYDLPVDMNMDDLPMRAQAPSSSLGLAFNVSSGKLIKELLDEIRRAEGNEHGGEVPDLEEEEKVFIDSKVRIPMRNESFIESVKKVELQRSRRKLGSLDNPLSVSQNYKDVFESFSHALIGSAMDISEANGAFYFAQLEGGGSPLPDSTLNIFVNTSSFHALPSYLNLLTHLFLRASGVGTNISLSNHPLPLTTTQQNTAGELTSFVGALSAALGLSFVPGALTYVLVDEKARGGRFQLHIAGLKNASFWAFNFVFDVLFYFVCASGVLLAFWVYRVPALVDTSDGAFGTVFLILSFGPASISFSYFLSTFFHSPPRAQTFTLGLSLGGLVFTLVSYILRLLPFDSLRQADAALKTYLFSLFPSFSLADGLLQIPSSNLFFMPTHGLKAMDSQVAGWDMLCLWGQAGGYLCLALIFENFKEKGVGSEVLARLKRFWAGRRDEESAEEARIPLRSFPYVREEGEPEGRLEEEEGESPSYPPPLRVSSVSKTYPGNAKKSVDCVSLSLPPGSLVGLLGPNGAGKTSLVRMVAGLTPPSSGKISIFGEEVGGEGARKRLGFCPQLGGLWPLLTVEEHLRLIAGLRREGRGGDREEEEVEFLLKMLNLESERKKLSSGLSGGNQRKLSAALSFLVGGGKEGVGEGEVQRESSLIVLDEPTTGVDIMTRRRMWKSLCSLSAHGGKNFLVTTHSLQEAESNCKTLAIMARGGLKVRLWVLGFELRVVSQCFGSPQLLRSQFGCSYELIIKLRGAPLPPFRRKFCPVLAVKAYSRTEEESCEKWVGGRLRGQVELLERMEGGYMRYGLKNEEGGGGGSVSIASLFLILEEGRTEGVFLDYSINQISIDKIFQKLTREEEEVEGGEGWVE